jgi:hypothetical protein
MEPRLAAHVIVGAFLRRAQAAGDFATILRKGDATSGSILICGLIRGTDPVIYERFASIGGQACWQKAMSGDAHSQAEVDDYLKRRTSRDPDIWLIELDTADQQRLTGLLNDIA